MTCDTMLSSPLDHHPPPWLIITKLCLSCLSTTTFIVLALSQFLSSKTVVSRVFWSLPLDSRCCLKCHLSEPRWLMMGRKWNFAVEVCIRWHHDDDDDLTWCLCLMKREVWATTFLDLTWLLTLLEAILYQNKFPLNKTKVL